MLKFSTKCFLLGYFHAENLKNHSHISNQYPQNYIFPKFHQKIKVLIFEPKVPYLDFFVLDFKKAYVVFSMNTLRLFYLQNFSKNHKYLNFTPRVTYLGIS